MEIIFVIHIILFCLSDAYFCPLRPDKEYKKFFVRNFPFISLMSVFYFWFFASYIFIEDLLVYTNYIDSYCNIKIALILVIYTIILFVINLIIVAKEIFNASPKAKNAKFLLIPVIFIFLYTSSVLGGAVIIMITNRLFDFSKGEKVVREICGGDFYLSDSDLDPDKYYLNVTPDILGHYKFKVSESVFDKAKDLSKYEKTENEKYSKRTTISFVDKIKLVVYVYKGLYGIRYFGKSMDIIKDPNQNQKQFLSVTD